jgi:hypothetical protein
MMFIFQTKNCNFFTQLKYSNQKLTTRQPTNFGIKNYSFILTAHVTAEQFKKSGI